MSCFRGASLTPIPAASSSESSSDAEESTPTQGITAAKQTSKKGKRCQILLKPCLMNHKQILICLQHNFLYSVRKVLLPMSRENDFVRGLKGEEYCRKL